MRKEVDTIMRALAGARSHLVVVHRALAGDDSAGGPLDEAEVITTVIEKIGVAYDALDRLPT